MEQKQNIQVLRADPAGNITLFVLSQIEPEVRAAVAAELMEQKRFQAEQVGFLVPDADGGIRMEMAGGEFCGNATRAFGLLLSMWEQTDGMRKVSVSGCPHPVLVETSVPDGTSRAQMPLPRSVRRVTNPVNGVLVDLGGIAHLVVKAEPSMEFFLQAESVFDEIEGLEAYGVIFLGDEAKEKDSAKERGIAEQSEGDGAKTLCSARRMTPLVKVKATNAVVFEGSCGSGSYAAAIAESLWDAKQRNEMETVVKRYIQPAGVIEVTIAVKDGMVKEGWIGGSVRFDAPEETEVIY